MGDAALALDPGRLDDDEPRRQLWLSMPRCSMCQSLAQPSSALYWHIGEMTMRLARVRPRSAIGLKSWLVMRRPYRVTAARGNRRVMLTAQA